MAFYDSPIFNPFGHYFESKLKGCSPPLHETPDYIRQQHRTFFRDFNLKGDQNGSVSYTATHQIDASTTSIKRLKRISLKDLHMEEATKGGYLVLRTIEPAYRLVAITTIVEDHDGNAVLMSFYNFADDFGPSSLDILPVGTVFIHKEPYIKMSQAKDCMLRCDCPTDIIILHEGHKLFDLQKDIKWTHTPNPEPVNPVSRTPRPNTAIGWKDRGNALFLQGKLEYATHCYLLALQEAEKVDNQNDALVMRMNLSAAYLQRGLFEASLQYSRTVLGFEPGNQKALLRAGRASYQLRIYKSAMQYYEVFQKLYPDFENVSKEFEECKNRVHEEDTGEFDIYKMYWNRVYKRGKKIDCADFVGPVKVCEVEGKGRGVVATKDLEPGTLVAVSKALAYSCDDSKDFCFQVNKDETAQFGNDIKLVSKVAQAIAKNPNTYGPAVYDLFDGQAGHPRSVVQLFCDPESKEEPIADVHRIRKILDMNCFMSPSDLQGSPGSLEDECPKGSGLFAFPSYFNHSCVPNANWFMFNDVLLVRVRQSISAGEELLISYFDSNNEYETRNMFCEDRGFKCQCSFCSFERSVPEHLQTKRQKLMETFRTLVESQFINGDVSFALIGEIKKMIKTIDSTYEKMPKLLPRWARLPFKSYLARAYECQGNCKEQIQCHMDIIEEYGFNVGQLLELSENDEKLELPKNAMLCQRVLYTFEKVILIYHQVGNTENVQKWIKLLIALERLYSGGGVNVVKFKYLTVKHLF